ncbi:MAG: branched-chain amino acid transaminase [Phycisphaerales bacterium]
MGFKPTSVIWKNGQWVGWHDATVHVLAHGLHYGSSVFEGVRAYATPQGPAIFRNAEHVRRLFESARIYGMPIDHTPGEIEQACREVVSRNGLTSAYIRPIVYRSAGTFSLAPGDDAPVEVAIAAIEWGEYLGDGAINNGIDVCVSSWRRLSTSAAPVMSKAGGHYLNAQLIAGEAKRNGYAEGIALDVHGNLSEGSGENVFVVRNGSLYTPPLSSSVLDGITRDTVIQLAAEVGIPVREQSLPREMLYTADEIFLTGTAAEITPVRSVDRTPVADGTPGPITRRMQEIFFGLFKGATHDRWGWLDFVSPSASAAGAHANGFVVRMRD